LVALVVIEHCGTALGASQFTVTLVAPPPPLLAATP